MTDGVAIYIRLRLAAIPQGASPYGVMDMAGNVSEFVMDFKNFYYYEEYEPDAWPANPFNEEGIDKGIRGGSWDTTDGSIRVSYRSFGGGTDGSGGTLDFGVPVHHNQFNI